MEAQSFKDLIRQHMDFIEQCVIKRVRHAQKIQNSWIVSKKENDQSLENQSNTSGDESSRSRNECNDKRTSRDDTDIRHSYDIEQIAEVPYTAEYNVFAVETQHSERPKNMNDTSLMENIDSNTTPDSSDMCDNDNQADQNVEACDDECVALANLITELETYNTLNDHTVDYEKLERKLDDTLRLLAQKEIDIKEGLKLKAYEILVVKEKHDELVKHSLLTKSSYEGLIKEKTKLITDLKLKEEKDLDKLIAMEGQLKFLNEVVYKWNQLIQPFIC
nr:hypothetical protein [Tanacetum cinerariifolium]